MATLEENFVARAPQGLADDECWPWGGNIRIRTGYGVVVSRTEGHWEYAHRYALEREIGPLGPDQTADHECHNRDDECLGGPSCLHRRCVNPRHLVPRSSGENAARAGRIIRTGRCREGHLVAGTNAYQVKGRKPLCRKCQLRRQKTYDSKKPPAIRPGASGL